MTAGKLSLFLTFHLNLAYSSIREEQRAEIIEKCYWPLLRLIEQTNVPIGLEASAYTLECIEKISPKWLETLSTLCNTKKCEFIGSGYCQVIGPLVPAKVNEANLAIGNRSYAELLHLTPATALINEQAWSTGLIDMYLDGGFETVIMEWNNPYSLHPNWKPELRYHPQKVLGHSGKHLNLIWNDSIVFQKFQRVIHRELSTDDLIQYLHSHRADHPRCLSLYGNDTEIFNYRPGRFETEAEIKDNKEWERIGALLDRLQNKKWIDFVFPSEALHRKFVQQDQPALTLSTAKVPIPVKKQTKYNSIRWAVSGRDDLLLNTLCHQFYTKIIDAPSNDPRWKELCYFWSSDFRTHITSQRFGTHLKSLKQKCSHEKLSQSSLQEESITTPKQSSWLTVKKLKRHLELTSPHLQITLNTLKGMSIHSLIFYNVSESSLLGTIEHGYFDDINYAADFFSGHMIVSSPGKHQATDLYPVQPHIHISNESATITSQITTPELTLLKTITLFADNSNVTLDFDILFTEKPKGNLRLGHITLNPQHFDQKSLFFQTHNGGKNLETFHLKDERINHFTSVSNLISANTCLALTENVLNVGDASNYIHINIDKTKSNCVGGIQYVPIKNSYLLRHVFSAMESDDTTVHAKSESNKKNYHLQFSLTLSAHQTP